MRNRWEFCTKIEYERDGRKIIRHCGRPTLSDDGEFKPNMHPKEYVDFRYKVDYITCLPTIFFNL